MNYPYSSELKTALENAQNIAFKYSLEEIGTEHVLFGIASVKCAAAQILAEAGVSAQSLEMLFKKIAEGRAVSAVGGMDFSPRVRQTFTVAYRLSRSFKSAVVTPEHMLFCLLQDNDSLAHTFLSNNRIDINFIMTKLKEVFEMRESQGDEKRFQTIPAQLNDLGADITKKARENKIDPIIGRKDEIERIIQILCRKTKNNPVLIGEPGVGKSAVVEGLALAISNGTVPDLLKDKIIFSLDLGSLMAGTKYRGSLEEKLKEAIELIKKSGNIIVFIDEIHTLAQAGADKGEVTPSDMLKPYLARGELQTIGATTLDEYRKYIEEDKALERRFQPILVSPPNIEDSIAILRGIRESYEAYHKIKLSDEAIEAAVKLSDRYITDRFLPDKAIDLIDEAMAKAKVGQSVAPPDLKDLEAELQRIEDEKQRALEKEDYGEAAIMRDKIKAINEKISEVKLEWGRRRDAESVVIDADDIASIVAKWTKIPVTKLNETEKERLVNLEQLLHERVIGQNEAVVSVARAIRRARAGLKDSRRPIGSFIFLGPTGVGKTELTKALAEAMFDTEDNIIRLDMSEYMEAHSISRLIGSPPGYVGHDEGGQLTEAVRRKPYSVVLFDEIEKAHPDIYNSLLQILDEGRLTDSRGRVVSFKNTVIILTSNAGVDELRSAPKSMGFSGGSADNAKTEDLLMNALKRRFKPEFLNRVDVITIFHSLTKADVERIAHIMLDKVEQKLREKNISISITKSAVDYLVEKGYDPEYGARPLRRLIEQTIEDTLAEEILSGNIRNGAVVNIDAKDGRIVIG